MDPFFDATFYNIFPIFSSTSLELVCRLTCLALCASSHVPFRSIVYYKFKYQLIQFWCMCITIMNNWIMYDIRPQFKHHCFTKNEPKKETNSFLTLNIVATTGESLHLHVARSSLAHGIVDGHLHDRCYRIGVHRRLAVWTVDRHSYLALSLLRQNSSSH